MKEQIQDINFYEIDVRKNNLESYAYRFCTYNDIGEIKSIFKEQKENGKIKHFNIVQLDQDWIIEDEYYWFPMFCLELGSDYSNLNELIEDILIGKLSGVLNRNINE